MKKILVIEDEKKVMFPIVELLENTDYKVITAEDSEEAKKLLERETPDLIIADLIMPKVDGYQVVDYFYKKSSSSRLPLIIISNKIDTSEINIGMKREIDDFIIKQFTLKELNKAINTQFKKIEKAEKFNKEICLNMSTSVHQEFQTQLISAM